MSEGNAPHQWRTALHDIEPDTVYRSVRIAGGLHSWADPHRTLYQLSTSTIEVYEQGDTGTLLINDADQDTLLNTAARLGYAPETLTLTQVTESVRAARRTERATA